MSRNVPLNGTSDGIWTLPNKFGISRRYFDYPTSIPDQDVALTDLTNPVELYDLEAEPARLSLNTADSSPVPKHKVRNWNAHWISFILTQTSALS
jgi:hypothetical protein